jgi:uncharacterized protein (DUF1499 family)
MSGQIKLFIIIIGIIVFLLILTRLGLFSGKRPTNLGVVSGKLTGCPTTPNCVSSQADDIQHSIAPLPLMGDLAGEQQILLSLLKDFPLVNIVVNEQGYIHAEFMTSIMMYTDDVEFLFDTESSVIQIRSASRLGSSDFGLNRRRMEKIRQLWLRAH